ncbi:MAG TPA: hypothetical protein VIM16_21340 [Mucilaginibacter sp.]|jgi:sugar lactone lactonase YvrE
MQNLSSKFKLNIFILAFLAIFVFNGCSKTASSNVPPSTITQTTAKITTVFSGFDNPNYISVDGLGNLFVTESGDSSIICQIDTKGVTTTFAGNDKYGLADGIGRASSFSAPNGIVIDPSGIIYVVDTGNGLVRKISPGADVSTFVGGNVDQSHGFADNGVGKLASFYGPIGITEDNTGNLYVSDTQNNLVRKITSDGTVSTFAGKYGSYGSADGTGTSAIFWGPTGLAADAHGNIYVADNGRMIRKITPDGIVTTFAGNNNVGIKDGKGIAASFNNPNGLVFDSLGNLFVADTGNGSIRKVTPAGDVSTYLARSTFSYPTGLAIDKSDNLYIVDSYDSKVYKVSKAVNSSTNHYNLNFQAQM